MGEVHWYIFSSMRDIYISKQLKVCQIFLYQPRHPAVILLFSFTSCPLSVHQADHTVMCNNQMAHKYLAG
jgi:hypothetical protein